MNGRHFLELLKSARYSNHNNTMAQFHARMLWMPALEFYRTGANCFAAMNRQQFRRFHQPNNDELIAEFQSSTRGMPMKAAEEVEETAQNADEWGIMQQKPQKVTHLPNPQVHQSQQQLKLRGESARRILAQRMFNIGTGKGQLRLVYEMGRSGRKFLQLQQRIGGNAPIYCFPNILVPEDVFSFVKAMDEVLNAVHTNKSKIQAPTKLLQERLPLHTAKAKGTIFDFQLELYLSKSRYVRILMRTVPNEHKPEHKPKSTPLPLRQFLWFRHAIGQILAECGEQRVQLPPNFPSWLNDDGFPHVLPPSPNNNNFVARKPSPPQPQQQPLKIANKTEPSAPTSPTTTTVALMQQLLQMFAQQQKQLQQMQHTIGAWLRQREEKNNNGGRRNP